MLIISQVRRTLCKPLLSPTKANLHLSLEMRFVDDGNRHGAIYILERSYFEVFSGTASIDADGSRAREAEVSGKGPETTGYFEGVALKADKDGIATTGIAGVVLSAPPVQVARCVT